jgi:hypothetical protein
MRILLYSTKASSANGGTGDVKAINCDFRHSEMQTSFYQFSLKSAVPSYKVEKEVKLVLACNAILANRVYHNSITDLLSPVLTLVSNDELHSKVPRACPWLESTIGTSVTHLYYVGGYIVRGSAEEKRVSTRLEMIPLNDLELTPKYSKLTRPRLRP